MKKTVNTIVTREETQLIDIICNKCENSLRGSCDYEGLVEVEVGFGYDSKWFGDSNLISFSLCEKCLWELTRTFKIPCKETGSWMDQLDEAELEG